MSIKFEITIPKPNLKWYHDSKKDLLRVVEEHNRESWSKQVDPVTERKWDPRKPPTGSHPLLNKSGKMFKTTSFKSGSRPFSFYAETRVNYGGFHQKGTSKMPRRRWLGINSKITKKMAPIFRENLFSTKSVYKFKAGFYWHSISKKDVETGNQQTSGTQLPTWSTVIRVSGVISWS